jgi:hypothetical protein
MTEVTTIAISEFCSSVNLLNQRQQNIIKEKISDLLRIWKLRRKNKKERKTQTKNDTNRI